VPTLTGNSHKLVLIFRQYREVTGLKAESGGHILHLTPEESEDMYFEPQINRWISKRAYRRYTKMLDMDLVSKTNASILSELADFESTARLVQLLERIPNFKIKLTQEEQRVIEQESNVLALGRSGTGKTTCAVLRLFAQDMLFKMRVMQSNQAMLLKDKRADTDDLKSTGIHSIFVTASPVLTNEVSRYYQKLEEKVQAEIKRKNNLKNQPQKETNRTENVSEIILEASKEGEVVQETKPEQEGKEEEEEINEEEYLMDEEEAEALARLNKDINLIDIDDKEFPLFLTVKRLILLIDGTLARPFFARSKDHGLISVDTRAQWHNELKGVMMINNKFKAEEDVKEEELDLPEEEEDLDQLTEEEIEVEYQRYQEILLMKKNQEQQAKTLAHSKVKFEIEYEYFYHHFWCARVLKKMFDIKLSPMTVWSEFMSNIKGSASSFLYPDGYLPRSLYTDANSADKSFLSHENKSLIYDIFEDYVKWKEEQGGYDFLDVINHILREVHYDGYYEAPIHFLMIDEVQDLSHAAISLLMKVTEQGVFFAGDTAQTIAKGVSVRFSDLSSLFAQYEFGELSLRKPTVHQLTVSFFSLVMTHFRLISDLMERSLTLPIQLSHYWRLSSLRQSTSSRKKRARWMVLSPFSSRIVILESYLPCFSVLKITRV